VCDNKALPSFVTCMQGPTAQLAAAAVLQADPAALGLLKLALG